MKRFHDATGDVTESDRVRVRYNKMKAEANLDETGEESIGETIVYFLASFAVAVVIMAMAAVFSFILFM